MSFEPQFDSDINAFPDRTGVPAESPQGGWLYRAFIGPLGLRAGWGVLLFLILSAILVGVFYLGEAGATGRLSHLAEEQRLARDEARHDKAIHAPPKSAIIKPADSALGETSQALGVVCAAAVLAFAERRRFGVFGLPASHRVRDLLPGAFWGIASLSVLVALLRASHALVFDGRLLQSGGAALRYGLAWLAIFFCVGVFEEFLFRGYIQFTVTRGLLRAGARLSPEHTRAAAFALSATLMTALFCFVHAANGGETAAGLAGVFLAGVVFSYALWKTGSLWWGVGFHMTWDWAQSFLFGVPDSGNLSVGRLFPTHPAGRDWLSGGIDGPEGSVLLLPVLAGVMVLLSRYKTAPQPPLEPLPPRPATVPPPIYPGSRLDT